MTEKDKERYKIIKFVDFVKKKYYLIKFEIIVILLVNIEVQLIVNVILMYHKNRVISSHLYFTILVIMIVICSLRN